MNYQLLPRMMKMKDDSSAIIWRPIHAYGIAGPAPTGLFGKEIVWTEKLPGVGKTGDVVLTDLSQYGVDIRPELVIEQSNAPGWLRDVQSFPLAESSISPGGRTGGDTTIDPQKKRKEST